MAYAAQSDLEQAAGGAARLLELADFDGDGVIDAAAIATAIDAAESWMDPFLNRKFGTPIANPSRSLKRLAADQAIYELKRRRGMLTDLDISDFKMRLEEMQDYAKGLRRPNEPGSIKSSAVRSVWIDRSSDDGAISRKDFEEYPGGDFASSDDD